MKAVWNDEIVAESDRTIEVEGNQYFPPESVKTEYLHASDTQYTCPWKGKAKYFHIVSDGKRIEDGAWSYPNPTKEAEHIKGYVAFWDGMTIED